MALDRMIQNAGVSLLLYSYPVRLVFEDNTAFGVVIGNKSGEQIIKAGVVVDATEEALLWRQTDVDTDAAIPAAKQSIFFNHLDGAIELPLKLNDKVEILSSVWDDEVRVVYEVAGYDLLTSRRMVPDILKLVRSEVSQLKDALVSHAGVALSIASDQSGNRALAISKEMDTRIKSKQDMEIALRAALAREEFSVVRLPETAPAERPRCG
jgi:hypothetical protein